MGKITGREGRSLPACIETSSLIPGAHKKKKKSKILACNHGNGALGGDRSLRFTGQQDYLTESESPVLRNTVGFHG